MEIKRVVFWIMFIGFFVLIAVMGVVGKKQREAKELELEEEAKRVQAELEKETFRTDEEILGHLNEAMDDYTIDNVYMRVPGTYSDDELMDLARKIDPMKGRVTKMSYSRSTTRVGDNEASADYYAGINYSFEICDEYYVTQKIKEGKEIPNLEVDAQKLCDVCEKFLSEYIQPGMSDYDKELAVHDYIVNNCEYSFSDKNDMSEFYAFGALVNHKAVCSGYSRATALLLDLCDIDVKLISGDANNNNAADNSNPDGTGGIESYIAPDGTVVDGHMWNQVKIEGLWYNLDTTWDDPVGGEQTLRHTYFNVDDAILRLNHEWDSKDAEICSSTIQNYYEKNGLFFKSGDAYKEYLGTYLSEGNRDVLECAVSYPDTSEEGMYFVFDYSGITSYQITTCGVDGYEILSIEFNPPQAE